MWMWVWVWMWMRSHPHINTSTDLVQLKDEERAVVVDAVRQLWLLVMVTKMERSAFFLPPHSQ